MDATVQVRDARCDGLHVVSRETTIPQVVHVNVDQPGLPPGTLPIGRLLVHQLDEIQLHPAL